MSKGYERMYQDMYCDFGLKKEKSTRVGLEPTTSGLTSGALSTQLSSPMLVVSLFSQHLCLVLPVRSRGPIYQVSFLCSLLLDI